MAKMNWKKNKINASVRRVSAREFPPFYRGSMKQHSRLADEAIRWASSTEQQVKREREAEALARVRLYSRIRDLAPNHPKIEEIFGYSTEQLKAIAAKLTAKGR